VVEVLPAGFKPPIMEAVLEIECDMPQKFDVQSVEERARVVFVDRYPTPRKQMHSTFQVSGPEPQASMSRGVQALQFLQLDEKQLVQVRAEGFAFNRLAPYSTMDDYLGEIRRTFSAFVDLTSPLQLRRIKLRYIAPTGTLVNVIMASQALAGDFLPVVLDIETQADQAGEPKDWALVAARIQDLRSLAKRVFTRTISARCLQLFL